MTEPQNRQKAEALMGKYLDALAEALEGEDVKAALLAEARKFLQSQGITIAVDGSAPAGERQQALQSQIRALKGEAG